MANVAVDERSALLPGDHTGASSDDLERRQSYTSSLRRISSANLPPYHEDRTPTTDEPSSALTIWTVVPVSLLGVFVANLDGSLIIASSQQIASEFNALSNASWLVTSFVLALCASQPLYGKLSDIFGRRSNLTVSYVFFAAGCFLCGVGQQYWQVIAGRAISGVGGAGMTALVSIIIADVVPVRQVASWRSYVNIAATTGRALGGPLGGVLCDTIGWRWCFYGQVPPTIIGLLLILWKLPTRTVKTSKPADDEDDEENEVSVRQKLARVDVPGALVLMVSIVSFLLALEFVTEDLPLASCVIPGVVSLLSLALFYRIEKRWAKEPILPIELFTNADTLTAYVLVGVQMAGQFGLFYSVPIYFQIISGTNVGQAGLRLVPSVVGNATAGLIAGYMISRTGRYKVLTVLGNCAGWVGYFLVLLRWGRSRAAIHPAETLYIFLGGFATGTDQSTTFIHLAANLDASKMAVAGTTLYLIQNLFLLIGIQLATAILQARLRIRLDEGLDGVKHKEKIIDSVISSVRSIRTLPPRIRDVVIGAYLDGLVWFATLGVIAALFLRERKL
ncbi:Vacuolar membrane amino acid uptake transporter fnx2 [Cladophialophora carrionii]|uniref:Vacuolar membrane amino acid uptake transporter fnx2 n=1 Tax=Cladophialophora carrionii TaxID=86049 RepID=A0A1C1D0S5_9EURO|nr:Vacuolar membrane amino acid uptake transporter fnx2 [Cladophialophora carrionii]